jgi:hypothetical protein
MQASLTAAPSVHGAEAARFSPEFRLVLACLRWPFAEAELHAIREAAAAVRDWPHVFAVGKRHRVLGLLSRALKMAGVTVPDETAAAIQTTAATQTRMAMILTIETIRLGKLFRTAALDAVFLKGATLTAMAYGDASLRHAKDVDLWVPQGQVTKAVGVLHAAGYTPMNPLSVSLQHQGLWLRYGKSMDWRHCGTGAYLELHWRLTDLPLLQQAPTERQQVAIAAGMEVTTLGGDALLAYLCVHGGAHGWGRLKWLADVYTLLPHNNALAVEAVYRRVQRLDAGRTVGQALLLCHDLLGLEIGGLERELAKDPLLQILRRSTLRLLSLDGEALEVDHQPFGSTSVYMSRFLLGSGVRAVLSELRTWTYRPEEIAESRLPRGLFFLFPAVRVASWLTTRVRHGGRSAPLTQ